MTISDERIERAAMAMCSKLEWTPPNKNGHGAEQIRGKWRKRARAALEADAPEIAATELRAKIEGLKEARGIANTVPLNISAEEWTVGAAIDSITKRIVKTERRLSSLQPEVAKREEGI